MRMSCGGEGPLQLRSRSSKKGVFWRFCDRGHGGGDCNTCHRDQVQLYVHIEGGLPAYITNNNVQNLLTSGSKKGGTPAPRYLH